MATFGGIFKIGRDLHEIARFIFLASVFGTLMGCQGLPYSFRPSSMHKDSSFQLDFTKYNILVIHYFIAIVRFMFNL